MRKPQPYDGENWGFDNGAYRDYTAGKGFDGDRFMQRLERAHMVGVPYLAVVPDIVAGGERSLEFSLRWMGKLPAWPWYLAVQDGMEAEDVEPFLDPFAGIFLGGTDRFKSTAVEWRDMAYRQGKRFHYGRAGTPRKIIHAMDVQADSADSAFPLWTKARMKLTAYVLSGAEKQLSLGVE